MNLKDLIDALKAADPQRVCPMGFSRPHSYRGSYDELAFESTPNVTVAEMLQAAQSAVDQTYGGYKGGSYTMGEYTTVNIADYGCCGEEIGPVLLGYMLGTYNTTYADRARSDDVPPHS